MSFRNPTKGKHRPSLNALRHGLTGQTIVMPADDLAAYQRHLASFTDEYHPQGATESHLVQALADTSWRLNRVAALETNLLNLAAVGDPIADAFAIASALATHSKALANLSMHTQRLSRQFERTVTQLRALQNVRRAEEKQGLQDFVNIIEMYESREEPFDPAEYGFVFSETEIHESILARRREELIEAASTHHHRAAA